MGGRGSSGGGSGSASMAKLKGSEKQISWATDIRKDINDIFDDTKKYIKAADYATKEQKAQEINYLESIRKRINSAEYAGDIITLFRDVRRTGNPEDDYPRVLALFNVRVGMTEGQRKILGR